MLLETEDQKVDRLSHYFEVEKRGKAFTTEDVIIACWRVHPTLIQRDDFRTVAEDMDMLGYVSAIAELHGHIVRAWRKADDEALARRFADRVFLGAEDMPDPIDLTTSPKELARRADRWLAQWGDEPLTLGDLLVRGLRFDRHALGYRHTKLASNMLRERGYKPRLARVVDCWMYLSDRRQLN